MSDADRRTRKWRSELSQHFLRDSSAQRLVRISSLSKSDFVIEIGPGRGALTRPLIKHAGRLLSIERDPYLAEKLRGNVQNRAQVLTQDFLAFDLPDEPYCVFGNIPYSRSNEIVQKLAGASNPPRDAWLVVQREFAYRLCGLPYSKESVRSLCLKPFWHVEILDHLQRNEFNPPPAVDSVFMQMKHRGRPILDAPAAHRYVEVVRTAFKHGGPMSQAVSPLFSKTQIVRLAEDLKYNLGDHPSHLQFVQWLGIARYYTRMVVPKKPG